MANKQKANRLKKWRFKLAAGVEVLCAICGEPISLGGTKGKGGLTVDHIIPKALGGTYAKDNLQPAHARCNHKRQTMLLSEFKKKTSQETILRRAIEILDKNAEAEGLPGDDTTLPDEPQTEA